eukprot:s332_g67.t1
MTTSQDAAATNPADKEMIDALVERYPGKHEAMNRFVRAQIRNALRLIKENLDVRLLECVQYSSELKSWKHNETFVKLLMELERSETGPLGHQTAFAGGIPSMQWKRGRSMGGSASVAEESSSVESESEEMGRDRRMCRTQESCREGIERCRGRTLSDGTEGWFTMSSCSAWTPTYKCLSSTVLNDGPEISEAKALRKLDVGELLEAVDTPVFEKSAGLLRLQLRTQKERAPKSLRMAPVCSAWCQDNLVGFATLQGNQGTVLLQPLLDDVEKKPPAKSAVKLTEKKVA